MGGVGVHSHFRVKPPTTVEVTLWLNWGGDINNKTSILSLGIFVSLKEIGGSQFQSCREAFEKLVIWVFKTILVISLR